MQAPTAHVPMPDLTFRDDTPVSEAFGDVYFSKDGGIAETEHVYIRGNRLNERFLRASHFTIGELGFGTGLNFLIAWREWLRTAPANATLHYIAVEKYPLTPEMLRAALALQPELAEYAAALVDAYPLRLPGWHRVHFPRVSLTLGFGDVAELLPQLAVPRGVDAWFLDGFAPAKNPAMWEEPVLDAIANLSAPNASIATFTAARAVRLGLESRGFAMEKIEGYGHKRNMLIGRREMDAELVATPASQRIVILGSGIAGATLAHALATRGHSVTVVERGELTNGASGNPAAVLFPQLTKRWTLSAHWYFTAYSFMLRQLAEWTRQGLAIPYSQPGMLRLPRHEDEETQLRLLQQTLGLDPAIMQWIDRATARDFTGAPLATGGAWFAAGTWLAPAALCHALLQHPRITVHAQSAVESIRPQADGWQVVTSDHVRIDADHCCIATGADAARFFPEVATKIAAVGGQVSVLDATQTASSVRSILCHKGYLIPAEDRYIIGATYNHGDASFAVTEENHQRNCADVEQFLPGWIQGVPITGRTSLRATTPDRMPLIGAILPGLWISAGHGSRGMLSAPLGAELIASAISGEPAPVGHALQQAVAPHRFKPA